MKQRETQLIMTVLIVILVWLWVGVGAAVAQQEASLRGKYNLGFTRWCEQPALATGNPSPQPDLSASVELGRFTLDGVATFDGDGTGSFSGTQVFPASGAQGFFGEVLNDGTTNFLFIQHLVSCPDVSYTVATNGQLRVSLGTCTLTVLPGSGSGSPDGGTTWVPLAGSTATMTNIQIEGRMSLDGTIIGLTSTTTGESLAGLPSPAEVAADVEFFIWVTGPFAGLGPGQKRLCKGNGLATSQR